MTSTVTFIIGFFVGLATSHVCPCMRPWQRPAPKRRGGVPKLCRVGTLLVAAAQRALVLVVVVEVAALALVEVVALVKVVEVKHPWGRLHPRQLSPQRSRKRPQPRKRRRVLLQKRGRSAQHSFLSKAR